MNVHSEYPIYSQMSVADAVRCVRGAYGQLTEGSFRLDEAGYDCELLNDLRADTAALLACWAGRPIPIEAPTEEPAWIVQAAIEWRRANKRSY